MDRWLSAVEDAPWVRWSYTAEQWRRWVDVEVERTSSVPTFQWGRNWYKFVLPVVGIAVGVAIFSPGSWLFKGMYVAGITALLVVMIVAGQRSDRSRPQRVRAQLIQAEPEVCFGQEGVFADGVFTPWLTSGVYLLGAWLDERPPRSRCCGLIRLCRVRPAASLPPWTSACHCRRTPRRIWRGCNRS